MNQYYYLDNNNQQVGPFSVEQLRTQPITPDTLVWMQGMTNWTRAADVPEIRPYFGSAPTAPPTGQPYGMPPTAAYPQVGPAPQNFGGYPGGVMPKTWLVESILVTLFCCLPLGIVGIINASRVESRYRIGDLAGAQQASLEAGRWTKYGLLASLVIIGIYFLLFMLGIAGAIFSS
ncbi:CD225/dispanin family protein [Tellurirhabdus rosea]|uniref:CD225/dispanin family protein n=1 Tax=Tellurirhabdus rosea TaxID=2674997 RepID=UPI00225500AC|nr:CD225/dispanin family protein [Tellurirhabdus rosea]